ncbi:hypothetical protein JOL79_10315 [Microbispora sp. RL4-1S]|uniref:Uncharacterized protein n=1 Tax=Microbispora oryzae TaxID=2806554 RepID=A0A940WMK1_9ACTN|nr:hypothetical protein [Microbispora oryzae]MBP2704205.1 hypothetical protein [Microbispora oryzae]
MLSHADLVSLPSFSTMTPHAIRCDRGPAEILCILDHNGEHNRLRTST